MTELFIENNKLDLSDDIDHLLTFAIDDIKDFAARNTSYSKTLVIPGTANNNRLFGSIFDVRVSNPYSDLSDNVSTNFNPSVEADCIVLQNHVQIFKGTLRVLEIIIDGSNIEYEVSIVGELGGLVSSIGTKLLENLDFSLYNHVYNIANVTGSWNNNASGYFYPLIDYGLVSTDKIDYSLKALRPAFFVREYIDKILTSAGYTYTSSFLNTTRFKNLIIPNNQVALGNLSTLQFYGTADVVTYTISPSVAEWTIDTYGSFIVAPGDFNRYTWNSTNTVSGKIRVTLDGYYNCNNDDLNYLYVDIIKNGSIIERYNAGTIDFFYLDFTVPVSMAYGDWIEVQLSNANGGGVLSLDIYEGTLDFSTDVAQIVELNNGDNLVASDMIPRGIYQKDFLSSVMKLFNLYITEDKNKPKHVNIEPYIDYYNLNATGMVDWTKKIDRSKPMRLKPMSELNSRYYNFKFKTDSDNYNDLYQKEYNAGFGDYSFDSGFVFSNDTTDIELVFSATPLVGYQGVDKMVSAIYKLESGVEKPTAHNIRIMQKKLVTGVDSWNIKDGVSTLWTGTDYPYAGNYDDPDAPTNDIHFGVPRRLYFTLVTGTINVTQFNVYWSPYMAEITDKDSRLMVTNIKLNTKDIFDLDFSKLVYADGCYWRINKIIDWNFMQADICKIELLKVINTVY